MRRRDLLRAIGLLGMSSALPVAACTGGSTPGGTTSPSPTVPATTDPAVTTAPSTTPAVPGGRLVQAAVHRQTPPTAESVRNKLLPISATLYRTALPGNDNAVLSPYSIVSALGMLALGARGTTAKKLATVLGNDATTVARWMSGVDAELRRAVTASKTNFGGPPSPAIIEPANAVFVRPDGGVRPAYLDALAIGYGAGVREVDFEAAAAAAATINGWVGDRTHGLIPHLLPPDFVDASTLLVLVNALYLKAAWAGPFEPGTSPRPFTTPSRTVQIPFMTRVGGMPYASGAQWRAVSIPLLTDLAMTVILPDAGAFTQISARLDATLLGAAMNGEERMVEVAMPAFTTDVQTDLVAPLKAMGLAELFDAPDLSGIADGVRVSGAIHQARVVVDHDGIEAAAATAIAVAMSLPAPEAPFRLDRPFLYLVHDVQTRTPLFLGRVTDPTR